MRTRSKKAVAKRRVERKLAAESVAPKSEPESEPETPAKSSEETMDEVKPPSPDQSAVEEAQVSKETDSVMMEVKPTPPRTRRVVKKVVRMVKKRQLVVSTATSKENAEEAAKLAMGETEESIKVEMEDKKSVDAGKTNDSDGLNVEKPSEMEERMLTAEPADRNESQMEGEAHVGKEKDVVFSSPESAQPTADDLTGSIEEAQKAVELELSAIVAHNGEKSEELVKEVEKVPEETLGGILDGKVLCQADMANTGETSETKIAGGNTSSGEKECSHDEGCGAPLDVKELKEIPKETMGGRVDDKGQCQADSDIHEGSNETKVVEGTTSAGQGESARDEGYRDRLDLGDPGKDELIEDDNTERAGDVVVLDEERKQLTAVSEERKSKKEYEIFVGGLGMDASEEHVKKAFEYVGPVVEVRLYKDLSKDKSRIYAFVRFSSKDHVKRALSEMKNPVICGKRCGTAPSEDNDTLFIGNICNTWTKEAIRQRLKDYSVERVESITLVSDAQHEGISRGFAFLEFSSHDDAMFAYRRLQKPDAVFGHPERTAKVAFAEPLSEPDPQLMAEVKTVFLDGLPLNWDEDHVREWLKGYGEITRIALARNMRTAKRKDFGFVHFSTHGAAVSCIKGINDAETSGVDSMTKVRARFANPSPKTQAVKGGIRGGFLIGHVSRSDTANSSRLGRGIARGGHHFNTTNSQRGGGFNQRRRGQTSGVGPEDYGLNNRYDTFRGRAPERGGRMAPLRGGYQPADRVVPFAGPYGSNVNRNWHDVHQEGLSDPVHFRRQPYSEEAFDGPYGGRRYEDPYLYHDGMHGMKRPFYMTDPGPGYAEPSRQRPRFNYPDPAVCYHGTYPNASNPYPPVVGTYPNAGNPYPPDYYGSDHRPYPPYYGGDRGYGGGYYH